jgi:type IV pilus assembly protein PilP
MLSITHIQRALLAAAAIVMLSGCTGGKDEDLMSYIDSVKARPGGRIEPLPQIKPYETFRYQASTMRSPFVYNRPKAKGRSGDGLRPVQNRTKEYLEQFPLDTLDMVGVLNKNNTQYALLKTSDGLVHRVIVGNYIGQNEGRVVSISQSSVELEELVADGVGSFYKRPASIGLGE